MKYLLDTNIVSEPLRHEPNASIVQRLKEHQHEIAIPALVWHELLFGCFRLEQSSRRKTIERYLEDVVLNCIPILEYDWVAAEWQARERARLVSIGMTPSFADSQIAAVAFSKNLILVTLNKRDFQYFDGLKLENWL